MKKIVLLTMGLVVALMGQQSGLNTVVLTTPPPSGVYSQFVSNVGVQQSTNYCYWVVAVYPAGMSAPSGSVCTATANSTLDSSNYNAITWQVPNSAVTGFWVIRNTSNVFPGSGTNAVNATVLSSNTTSRNDQSNTLNSFTYTPISVAYAQMLINNRDFSVPVVQLLDVSGNVQAQWYETSGSVPAQSNVIQGNATISQINSGLTILGAVTGRTLRVTDFQLQAVGGAFGTCTLVEVTDTSNVVSFGVPIADLTQDTIVGPGASSVVFTTYSWQGQLTANAGLKLVKTGTACDTATSLNYRITYTINN